MLKIAWAAIAPLGLVLMHTFFLGSFFKACWSGSRGITENQATFLAGPIVHQLLSEAVARASPPGLENANFATRVRAARANPRRIGTRLSCAAVSDRDATTETL